MVDVGAGCWWEEEHVDVGALLLLLFGSYLQNAFGAAVVVDRRWILNKPCHRRGQNRIGQQLPLRQTACHLRLLLSADVCRIGCAIATGAFRVSAGVVLIVRVREILFNVRRRRAVSAVRIMAVVRFG